MPDKSAAPEISRLTAEKRPAVRYAILFVVTLCLLLLVIQIADAWRAHRDRLAETAVATTNMSHALAAQGESALRVVDTVLVGLVERIESEGLAEPAADRLHRHLKNMVGEVEELHGLFVFGADGRWLISSLDRTPLHNNADREYFQFHANNPDRRVHVGKPVRSRSTGAWVLPVSRRLNRPDGSFAGVALGTIRVEYFIKLYESFNVGHTGTILLTLDDGTMIYRYPYNERLIGADVSNGPVHRAYVSMGPSGTAMMRSNLDHIERLYSFQHLQTYPLLVATAQSKEDILAVWWKSTMTMAGINAVAVLLLLGFGWRLVRQIMIRDQLEGELVQAREQLQQHNRELAVLADHDGLTGIANRRRFEEALAVETARAARNGSPLSLLMFDVDYFKRYNDTYGHVSGDACLRRVAEALQDSLERPADLAARYGGEEFVALLPDTDPHGARMVAERIRAAVMALRIPHAGNGPGIVTISAGVHTLTAENARDADTKVDTSVDRNLDTRAEAASTLVERADALLYQAKLSGRNQVCGGNETPHILQHPVHRTPPPA